LIIPDFVLRNCGSLKRVCQTGVVCPTIDRLTSPPAAWLTGGIAYVAARQQGSGRADGRAGAADPHGTILVSAPGARRRSLTLGTEPMLLISEPLELAA
jgi:hypothetical protein